MYLIVPLLLGLNALVLKVEVSSLLQKQFRANGKMRTCGLGLVGFSVRDKVC